MGRNVWQELMHQEEGYSLMQRKVSKINSEVKSLSVRFPRYGEYHQESNKKIRLRSQGQHTRKENTEEDNRATTNILVLLVYGRAFTVYYRLPTSCWQNRPAKHVRLTCGISIRVSGCPRSVRTNAFSHRTVGNISLPCYLCICR